MILLPFLLLQIERYDGVPGPARRAYADYLGCLMASLVPAEGSNIPTAPAARKALVQQTLTQCHAQRVATVIDMEAKVPRVGPWIDPAQRHAKVEEIVERAEQGLTLGLVSPEDLKAIANELAQCAGGRESVSCQPSQQ